MLIIVLPTATVPQQCISTMMELEEQNLNWGKGGFSVLIHPVAAMEHNGTFMFGKREGPNTLKMPMDRLMMA